MQYRECLQRAFSCGWKRQGFWFRDTVWSWSYCSSECGVLKFTPGEAAGIQPLVAHSPLMSWMYGLLSVQGVSNVIGVIEIATAALMALRPLSRKASFVGSLAAVVTFLLTVSFLFSTPGAVHFMYGFPVLGAAGQFLIKDLVLLGASFWTAAEAFSASQGQGARRCV
jgi:reactive chlorine resistance protein C